MTEVRQIEQAGHESPEGVTDSPPAEDTAAAGSARDKQTRARRRRLSYVALAGAVAVLVVATSASRRALRRRGRSRPWR